MKLWKKLLLYFVSITGCLLLGIAVLVACSDEPDPYDYYTSFFNPNIQSKKDFGAFYFTDYRFTYTDDEPESEATINSAEWARYLEQPVTAGDVKKVMYELDSAAKQNLIQDLDQELPMTGKLANNTFLQSLKQPAHQAALQYFKFALEVEPLANTTYDEWNPAPIDTAAIANAAQKALAAAGTVNDGFIKLRYYYQAQRLFHYGRYYEQANIIYEQHIAALPSKSHIKGWALSYQAGEKRRLGDTTQAAYLFSKVFANYPERRVQAYRNYYYINAPFTEVLKLAHTAEEKAHLYAIKGFSNPEIEIENLEQVYHNMPSSPMVGTLLVREINKLEEYYLTPALSNNTDQFYSEQSIKKSYLQPHSSTKKWLLWTGIFVLFAGLVTLIISFKKQSKQSSIKIAGGFLALAGAACLIWFAVSRPRTEFETQKLSQGSFFVTMPDSVKTKYNDHIEKLRSFCTKLTSDAQYPEPQIGALADAYLYFMQNRPDDGLSALNKLEGQNLTGKLVDQKQVLNLLLSAQRMKQVKSVDEASLLPSLQWLRGKAASGEKAKADVYPENTNNYNHFAVTERNFYTYVLAPAYLRQGDTTKAALAMLNSNNGNVANYNWYITRNMPDFWFHYLHSYHLNQLISWKMKRPAERYLSFLSNGLKRVDADNLYELLGTIALREHHYPEATTAFQHVKNGKLMSASYNGQDYYSDGESYQGDPFYVEINDYPKYFAGKRYTKLTFAQRMTALESQLKAEPKADTYYLIANGLYNTSTYGNSWGLIAYQWSAYDFGREPLYYYDEDYINTSRALQYYLKARALSNDPEMKARCTFMAAKCAQKEHKAPSFMDNYDTYDKRSKEYMTQLKKNSYFKEMQQYKTTAFYRKAANECSYLSDFIRSNP
ncbi:hypothetical protein HH214_15725 [Mucilaginibacter robiniae]|uniref:Uncharacterized protein n=1 Tax=Mucilaginibacter robiniae TaxID=2728022 RepID=A0A7L5E627_9SPHI|nr:hypothetical protein [Mucilaginibacter robiniae]QJD97214.1 hypothetical protein HH214_15725 [Mucilaginibacter robiniae]